MKVNFILFIEGVKNAVNSALKTPNAPVREVCGFAPLSIHPWNAEVPDLRPGRAGDTGGRAPVLPAV